jgi:hypothetical protein
LAAPCRLSQNFENCIVLTLYPPRIESKPERKREDLKTGDVRAVTGCLRSVGPRYQAVTKTVDRQRYLMRALL